MCICSHSPQFLQRSRVISLYREIIRGTRRIADPNTRAESRRYARDEFERHRDVTDLVSFYILCPLTSHSYIHTRLTMSCSRDTFAISSQPARRSGKAWNDTLTECRLLIIVKPVKKSLYNTHHKRPNPRCHLLLQLQGAR